MKFIELTGKELAAIVKDNEIPATELASAGIHDGTIVRVNQQGDIEVRRARVWDVVGGLIGDFEHRIKSSTGRDWA